VNRFAALEYGAGLVTLAGARPFGWATRVATLPTTALAVLVELGQLDLNVTLSRPWHELIVDPDEDMSIFDFVDF